MSGPPVPSICKCGAAKSYHPQPDHEYEPRYPADAVKLGWDAARAAAPPVEPEPAARYGPDYTASRGPQIRRDGYHYGHCWRRWVEIEPDKVAPCICAEWPPLEAP